MALTMARPLSHTSTPYVDGPIWKSPPRWASDATWKSLPKQRPPPSAFDNGLGGQSLRSIQSRCPISSFERPLGATPLPGHILSNGLDIDDRFVDEVAIRRATGTSISPVLDGLSWSRHPLQLRGRYLDDFALDRRIGSRLGGRYLDDFALDRRIGSRLGAADDALLGARKSPLMDDPLCMTRSRYLDDRRLVDDPLWAPASHTVVGCEPMWRHSALDGRLLYRSHTEENLLSRDLRYRTPLEDYPLRA